MSAHKEDLEKLPESLRLDVADPDAEFGGTEARQRLERKLLWKIDLRMSIMVVIYILNYIDRNNAGAARLKGFEADLKLKGITRNFVGALLTRFFLGFVEAAFFPGALFLLSKWYKKEELGLRTAILYGGNIISNAFGSLLASGILSRMQNKLGHAAWRWLFYIEGSLTVAISIIVIFVLPDFPTNTRSLSPEERALAIRRMEEDAGVGDEEETEGEGSGFWLAITDIKAWWLAFALTSQVVALSFNAYFPTLSATLGYNTTVSLLLCAPPFVFTVIVAGFLSHHSDKVGERFYHIVASYGLGIVGFIIAISTMNTAARYVSLFLMAQSYAGFIVHYAWISNTFPRPPSKRAVALALINAFSQLGNIAGSQYLIHLNKKLDKDEEEKGVKVKGRRYML
ncbi:hypothetical protein H0H92_000891 [Tricholoma furcatifolium]|nr:hypothetical protein H0H92_000891 [Tricholoma furcatifolium]